VRRPGYVNRQAPINIYEQRRPGYINRQAPVNVYEKPGPRPH
jgi:hypothetical protein